MTIIIFLNISCHLLAKLNCCYSYSISKHCCCFIITTYNVKAFIFNAYFISNFSAISTYYFYYISIIFTCQVFSKK